MGGDTAQPGADTAEAASLRPADADAVWIERVASELERLGLAETAGLVLRGVRPLGWLGGQALWAAQPVLALFGVGVPAARLARTLEDEARFAALIAALAPTSGEDPR
jgi:hypothetical protein